MLAVGRHTSEMTELLVATFVVFGILSVAAAAVVMPSGSAKSAE
jgi:nitrate reductase NapE component